MKKQMGLSRSLWKKLYLHNCQSAWHLAYMAVIVKNDSGKKQKVENESTEIQQESEGEKMRMTTTEMEKYLRAYFRKRLIRKSGIIILL